jgi:hypothetical protein
MIVLKMWPGYAYKRRRGEWDTVMVGEPETERAQFVGYRSVDGNRVAVFKHGRSYYAQLAHSVRRVDTLEEVARTRIERQRRASETRARRTRERELERATRGRRGPPYELATSEQKLHAHSKARDLYLAAIRRERDGFDPRALRENAMHLRRVARELRRIRAFAVQEWVRNLLRQARSEDIRARALVQEARHHGSRARG